MKIKMLFLMLFILGVQTACNEETAEEKVSDLEKQLNASEDIELRQKLRAKIIKKDTALLKQKVAERKELFKQVQTTTTFDDCNIIKGRIDALYAEEQALLAKHKERQALLTKHNITMSGRQKKKFSCTVNGYHSQEAPLTNPDLTDLSA